MKGGRLGQFAGRLAERDPAGFFVFTAMAAFAGAMFLWSLSCIGGAVTQLVAETITR